MELDDGSILNYLTYRDKVLIIDGEVSSFGEMKSNLAFTKCFFYSIIAKSNGYWILEGV